MFKLALDAGHGLYTAGKRCLKSLDPNETREWTLNSRICDKIGQKLKEYNGVEVLRVDDTTGAVDIALANRCQAANDWGADFYLSIHHNAGIGGGTGGGFEVYRYIKLSPDGNTAKKQKIIADELVKAGVSRGNRSSNIKAADFAVLRDTAMEAALVECAFMDSATDVPVLLTDEFAERVAIACVNAVAVFGNLTKKLSEPPPVEVSPEEPTVETPPIETVPEEPTVETPSEEAPSETPPAEEEADVKWIVSFFKKIIEFIKSLFKGV